MTGPTLRATFCLISEGFRREPAYGEDANMKQHLVDKYRAFPPVDLPDRQWPSRTLSKAPIWCSVDLRDGNQALIEPMGLERKRRLFDLLVRMGFKEIEVGFPAASQTDYDFVRLLIEEKLIPDDVTIQVLTQAREHLIERSFEAISGARRAIVHLYNSTSTLQRRVVFKKGRDEIIKLAVDGTRRVRDLASGSDTDIVFQYSPESFTGTELDFAVEICAAVGETWGATADAPFVVNLPATVEMSTPNTHADQIEWFCRNVPARQSMIVSVHTHNDRGTGVAAAELAMLAGAQRIEGTLFGNGERTGNVDIVTLALNMFSQGINPQLDVGDIQHIVETAEYCTQLPVHPRHPYAGELVFTAFSGSHQDAIKKGMLSRAEAGDRHWEVPYLPIDPSDIGRTYESVVRINSQSGKGGIAYVMKSEFGIDLPRRVQIELSQTIQRITDKTGKEIRARNIMEAFEEEYLSPNGPLGFVGYAVERGRQASARCVLEATVTVDGAERTIRGEGNGPIDAFVDALRRQVGLEIRVADFAEHAIDHGANAKAIAFVELESNGGTARFGAGLHESIIVASLRAVVSAVNRSWKGARLAAKVTAETHAETVA